MKKQIVNAQENSDILSLTELLRLFQDNPLLSLLQTIGENCFSLSWNENDQDIIRNKFGYINRHKSASAKRNEFNGKHTGIHFEALGMLRHFSSIDHTLDKIPESFKQELIEDIQKFFGNIQALLNDDAASFQETNTLNTFSMLVGDLWTFTRLLNEFKNFNVNTIDVTNSKKDRYYLARIIVILGESAKMVSSLYKPNKYNSDNRIAIADLFHLLAKLRDLIKVKSHYVRDGHIVMKKLHSFFLKHNDNIEKLLQKCLLHNSDLTLNPLTQGQETLDSLGQECLAINKELNDLIKHKSQKKKNLTEAKKPEPKAESPLEQKLNKVISGMYKIMNMLDQINIAKQSDGESIKKHENLEKQLTKLKANYAKLKNQLDKQQQKNWPNENNLKELIQFVNSNPSAIGYSTKPQKKEAKRPNIDIEHNLMIIQKESEFICSLGNDSSAQSLYAQQQAIGYMGQAYKEVTKNEDFKELFAELGYSSWEQGIDKTIWTRHKRVMHDPLSAEPDFFHEVIALEIRPWTKDVQNMQRMKLLKQLLNSKELLKVHAKQLKQTKNAALISIHNEMGLIYSRCGKWEEAKQYFLAALSLKPQPLARCPILHNLGDVYRHFGLSADVLKIADEIYQIRKSLGNKEKLASALNDLAVAHSNMGDNKKAMDCYEQGLALSDDESKAGLMVNMAGQLADKGNHEQALVLYQSAKTQAFQKADWVEYTHIATELIYTYNEISKFQDAAALAEEIKSNFRVIKASIRARHGEQSFLHELRVFQSLAECLAGVGDYHEAFNQLETYIPKAESILAGLQHQALLSHFFNALGYICYKSERFLDAKKYLKWSISLCQQEQGKIMSRQTLGLVYIALNSPLKAKKEFIDVIRLAKNYDVKHIEAIASNSLASLILDKDGETTEAFTFILRALTLNKEIFKGADNHERAKILSILARYYRLDKKYGPAYQRLDECLQIMVRLFPQRDHPEFTDIYPNLVAYKLLLGDDDLIAFASATLAEPSVQKNTHAKMNIYRDMVTFYVLNNQAKQSLPYIQEFKKLHADSDESLDELLCTLSLNYRSFFALDQAIALLQCSIKLCPKSEKKRLALYHSQLAEMFQNCGQEQSGMSKYEQAAPFYKKAKHHYDICLKHYSEFFENIQEIQKKAFTCMACAKMYSDQSYGIAELLGQVRSSKQEDVQFFNQKDMPNKAQNLVRK